MSSPGFLVTPPDPEAPPFDWSKVVPVVCSSLDQVAALVEVHDGVACSEIRLEGTNFRVRLAGARRLESVFSPKEVRKYSELEREEIANRNARKWFEESRAAAGVMLRDAHKAQVREAKGHRQRGALRAPDPLARALREKAAAEATASRLQNELREERERSEDLAGQVVDLRGRVADLVRGAQKWEAKVGDLVQVVRTLTAASESAPMDDDTEEKALFLIHHWGDLPLEALRWIVDQERAA